MLDVLPNPDTSARQVELAVGRLDSLSTLPCVGAQLLSRLQQGQLSPAAIAGIIRSDPALAAMCLSLVCRRGINPTAGSFSLQRALDQLGEDEVRNAVLSVEAFRPFEPDYHDSGSAASLRKGLVLHSLAVACCAEQIAGSISRPMDPELTYYAGLLHDIGKLALRGLSLSSKETLGSITLSSASTWRRSGDCPTRLCWPPGSITVIRWRYLMTCRKRG
jgi:HD-like signal output (HDOD) protein